jgi:Sulfatase
MSRTIGRNALHLSVLSAFAFAQPLFDILGKTPEFFVVRGSRAVDIVFFALVVVLVPPLVLLAIEWLVGLASARAAEIVHLVFIAALAAIVAVQVVRDHSTSTLAVFAISAVVGIAFAALYARARAVQMFMTVLAPVPLLFLALFLVRAPVLKLEGTAKALTIPAPRSQTPVVLVVLDEFAEPSLMDATRHVDAGRYPAFAALARTATWYRNATSVHEHTTEAVPAILTGQYPKEGLLPLAKDHPDNVFTLLGKRYRMDVFESVTQLCPEDLCARRKETFTSRLESLADDLEVVYGHLVLPQKLEERLPSISNTWQNFGGKTHGDETELARNPLLVKSTSDIDAAVGRQMWQDQRFLWDHWVDGIQPSAKPTLYMIHELMPHYPWRFLPSGKQYGNSLGIDGLDEDTWSTDPWIVEQGWQRHLLQVGFTDHLLGELVARLRREGLWNRALVIVTADHGVSFIPGEHRRSVTTRNLPDIAAVPLFVKYPGQTKGRIDDRHVETVAIVPTIADVLGIRLPYHVDAQSLRDPELRPAVRIREREGGSIAERLAAVERGRDATLRRQIRLFGSGSWDGVYRIGPHRALVGRAVSSLPVAQSDVSVSIDGESLFGAVDLRSPLSPSHVTGRVSKGPLDLAVAVDGRIGAVTRTFDVDGDAHFAAFVPESAFRQGPNRVEVYAVRGSRLERLRGGAGAESTWTMNGSTLGDAAGHRVAVRPGALDGVVEDWFHERDSIRFGGWAADTGGGHLADSVLVFSGGRFVYAGTTTVGRKRIPFAGKGPDDVVRIGFVFDLPRSVVGSGPLRFFAVRGGVASELRYVKDFPWRAR